MKTNLATQLKEHGQQAALFGAGPVADQILELMADWCAARKASGRLEFLIEEFRMYVESIRPDINVIAKFWGSLPRQAVKRGLIRSTGEYRKTTSPATHGHVAMQWVVL